MKRGAGAGHDDLRHAAATRDCDPADGIELHRNGLGDEVVPVREFEHAIAIGDGVQDRRGVVSDAIALGAKMPDIAHALDRNEIDPAETCADLSVRARCALLRIDSERASTQW